MPYEIPTRWPLVETLSNREGDLFRDAKIINGYAEFDPQTKSYSVERRPGVVSGAVTSVPNGSSQGLFSFDNSLVQLVGTSAYRGGLFVGNVGVGPGSTGGLYTANFSSTDADIMMFGYPSAAYYLQSFVLHQIVDPNFPGTTVPGIGYINGRFYVMDPQGVIHGTTNLDDPTTWDPLNVIVAQQRSGRGVYLAQQLAYLCAMKANTVEIFWDSGQTATQDGTGSTLQPIPGATIPYGLQDPGSVQECDGVLLWMTTGFTGSPQVGRMDNLQFQIVSTPPVDRLLKLASYGSTGSMVLKLGGHRFYVLHINPVLDIVADFTLIYDLDQNLWFIWTDPLGRQWPYYHAAALGTATPSTNYVQHTSGQVYQIQEDYLTPTDLGEMVPVDIYTPNYDADIDREKYMPALCVNSDIVAGSQIYIRYSDDDYTTWTTPINVDLSVKKPMITDLGSFYRRAFHIRHAVPTPLRIKSLGMTMALGTL